MNDGALHDAYRRGSIGVQRMARENSSHEEAVGGVLEDKVAKHQQASAESGRSATLSGMQKLHEQQVKHQAKKAGLGTNALKERETSISHDHLERYLKDTVRRSLCCGGSGVLEGVRCRRDGDEGEGGGGGGGGRLVRGCRRELGGRRGGRGGDFPPPSPTRKRGYQWRC